jgi:DNA repair photolyase
MSADPGNHRNPNAARGATFNPKNRFESLEIVLEPDDYWHDEDDQPPPLRTQFFRDFSQSIITTNTSPDIPFSVSLNPYRGCEHGCAYCYARPTHEYLGFSAGLDFESRIMVKTDAPELLRAEFSARKWKPQTLAMSGVTDCYQPIERKLEITRGCLAVLAEFRNPVGIVTKNHLVTRDLDLLRELAAHRAAAVAISITTLDGELAKKLEPRASSPSRRLAAIAELSQAGIPVRVMFAPCIPGLNDHEAMDVLRAAAEAGACDAGTVALRLPHAVAPLFEQWLETHFPDRREKIIGRVQSMRGGKMNDPRFGTRMRGEGFFAEQMAAMFDLAKRKTNFRPAPYAQLSTTSFRVPRAQLDLF